MHQFIKELEKFVSSVLPKNIELLEITFNPENKQRILRVTLDGEELSLDTLAEVSRELSKWLDEHESDIPYSNYTFEVSSAGIDRPLKTQKDFAKMIGRVCKIETKNKADDGRKKYRGEIKSVSVESLTLFTEEENSSFEIRYDNIAKAHIDF